MTALDFIRSAWPGAVIALVGAPQTGKSRLAKEADAKGLWPRRIVFEPHGVRDRVEARRGKRIWPWAGRLVTMRTLLTTPGLLDADPLRLVVVPDHLEAASMGADFTVLGRLAWHTGDLAIIAEEAALYARNAIEIANLLSTGNAHAGIRLVMISQSFTRIPLDVRRCVSHVVAWSQSEAADVKALRIKCGRRFADAVAGLRRGASPLTWALGNARE